MKKKLFLLLLLAGVVLSLGTGLVQAQGPGYSISWWSVDGGGTMSASGGGYSLGGTAGQADAGVLTGGSYSLGGGFWHGGVPALTEYNIYLPIIMRNAS